MDEHGKLKDLEIIDDGLYLRIWDDYLLVSDIASIPGVAGAYYSHHYCELEAYLDPRYDREFIMEEIRRRSNEKKLSQEKAQREDTLSQSND